MSLRASSVCVFPQAAKNSLAAPKVPVPKQSSGTLKPERPRVRYSMSASLRVVALANLDAESGMRDSARSGGIADRARAKTKARARAKALARLNARYHHPVFLRKPRVGHPAKAEADSLRE